MAQWLSPAFPIGAYAYSQGLEAAIVAGDVHDAATAGNWIRAVLTHGSGRMDAIFMAQARHADADLAALSDLALAYAASSERAVEMLEQGTAFGLAIGAITGAGLPALPYALAVGVATRAFALGTDQVAALWLQGLAAQLVSVAVRFVPLGQTDGQRIITDMATTIVALAKACATATLADLGSSTVGADLAAMLHETMDVRIYRS